MLTQKKTLCKQSNIQKTLNISILADSSPKTIFFLSKEEIQKKGDHSTTSVQMKTACHIYILRFVQILDFLTPSKHNRTISSLGNLLSLQSQCAPTQCPMAASKRTILM